MRNLIKTLILSTLLAGIIILGLTAAFNSTQEEYEQQDDDSVYMENYYKNHKIGEENDTIKMRNTKRP